MAGNSSLGNLPHRLAFRFFPLAVSDHRFRFRAVVSACWLVLILVAICVPASPAKMSVPGVLVLVLSTGGPFDQVSINYASAIPKSEAEKDVYLLKKETSWPITNLKITVADTSTPGSKPSTSSVFAVPPLVNTRDGTLILEPFISVLRRFPLIEVDYLISRPFSFRGLTDFESRWVKIELTQAPNSYRYRVRVKDKGFERLGLPLVDQSAESSKSTMKISGITRILIIVVVAVLASLVAYFVASRFQRR
jgi:hypothetical protein